MLWVVEREKRTWSHQVGRRQCLEKADTQEAQGLRVLPPPEATQEPRPRLDCKPLEDSAPWLASGL